MSTDTPTPERVTLVGDDLTLVERVRAEAALCRAMGRAGGAYRLERIATDLAAREQALREEIAGEIETMPLPDAPRGCRYTRAAAADLARGGAR